MALPGLALPVLLSVFVDHVLGSSPAASWGGWVVAAAAQRPPQPRPICLPICNSAVCEKLTSGWRWYRQTAFCGTCSACRWDYFSHRFAGDLTARVQLVDKVAGVGSMQFTGVIIEPGHERPLSDPDGCVRSLFSPRSWSRWRVANAVLMRVVCLRCGRTRIDRCSAKQAMLSGISAVSLRNIESLRAVAAEDDVFSSWSGYQARELRARQRFCRVGLRHCSAADAVSDVGRGRGARAGDGWRVITGDMTIGMLIGIPRGGG